MLHDVSAKRAVCVSCYGVFGDAYGWGKHTRVRKNAWIGLGQREHMIAIATDISTERSQRWQVRFETVEYRAIPQRDHYLGVPSRNDLDRPVAKIVFAKAKSRHEPVPVNRGQRWLKSGWALMHPYPKITVVNRFDVYLQDAGTSQLPYAPAVHFFFDSTDIVRGNRGVTANRHFNDRRKKPDVNIVTIRLGTKDESRLGIVELTSDGLHLIATQSIGIGNHARRIASESVARKSIYLIDAVCHFHKGAIPNTLARTEEILSPAVSRLRLALIKDASAVRDSCRIHVECSCEG